MSKDFIKNYLSEVKAICDLISKEDIGKFAEEIDRVKTNKGRFFMLGVGGSAANASHAVNDFRKILNIESYCISDNVSELTARINDQSWELSYVESLKVSKPSPNDALLVFSVGGGSANTSVNLVRCMEYAKNIGSVILSVVSRDGGKARGLSDVCVLIPSINESRVTPHAEEWQMIILHLLVSLLSQKKAKTTI